MSAEERWVGVYDVAAHLGVAKDSVYRWIEERGLPAHRVGRLFREARPDRERLRLVAQALAGTCWRKDDGPERTVATTPAEAAALRKLVANWRALINQQLSADPLFHSAKG